MATIYKLEGGVLKPLNNDIAARKKYKEALAHKPNLEKILSIYNNALNNLEKYAIYTSVLNMLIALKNEKTIVELQLSKINEIIIKKGYL